MTQEQILALPGHRHVKMWLLHKQLGLSRKEIAQALGGTNPGAVGNELKKYENDRARQEAAVGIAGLSSEEGEGEPNPHAPGLSLGGYTVGGVYNHPRFGKVKILNIVDRGERGIMLITDTEREGDKELLAKYANLLPSDDNSFNEDNKSEDYLRTQRRMEREAEERIEKAEERIKKAEEKKQNPPAITPSRKKTIKDIVIDNKDILKTLTTHTQLREWAIKQGFDNRAAFPKFKLALNEIGMDYDQIKTGIHKKNADELNESITHQVTLYSDAKASAGRFGITDEDGNVLWYGKFFDEDADEQSDAELAAAKKAVWLASKVKEALGTQSILLILYIDAQWLTYQTHSGQKGYALTMLARKYNIKLNVKWIRGSENPADKWTTASGYKKWSDNDLPALAKPYITEEDLDVNEAGDGLLVGVKHTPQGAGILIETPEGQLKAEGGEILMSAPASEQHCETLSKWNEAAGGVAFPCDHPANDGIRGPMCNPCVVGDGIQVANWQDEGIETVSEAAAKFGWTATQLPDGFELFNRTGKKCADIKFKRHQYFIDNQVGERILSGRGQLGTSVEKVIEKYFYGKREAHHTMPQKYNIVEDKNDEGIFSYAIFKNGETEPTHKHWSVYGETYNQFCERISDDVAEETQGEHLIGIKPDVNPAGELFGVGTRVVPAMANAFKTERHYLKAGNIINEKKGDTVLYRYVIVGFKSDPTENVMVVIKEHSLTPGKPAPEFAIALSRMITSLEDGLYAIEGLPIETAHANALLRADAEIVEKELMCEAVHAYVKEQKERIEYLEGLFNTIKRDNQIIHEHLVGVNAENAALRHEGDKDTIEGMEAMHWAPKMDGKGTRVAGSKVADTKGQKGGTGTPIGRMIPKSITKVKNFYHVTLKPTKGVPKNIKKCATPEWAATIADAVHGGAKITMCSDGTNWWPQTILLPAKGEEKVIKRNAKIVANKILSKLAPQAGGNGTHIRKDENLALERGDNGSYSDIVSRHQNSPALTKGEDMKPYEQLRTAQAILNDKTSLVSYDNHGLTITFEYAPTRKAEILQKAEMLKEKFTNVKVKGNKWFKIEVITR